MRHKNFDWSENYLVLYRSCNFQYIYWTNSFFYQSTRKDRCLSHRMSDGQSVLKIWIFTHKKHIRNRTEQIFYFRTYIKYIVTIQYIYICHVWYMLHSDNLYACLRDNNSVCIFSVFILYAFSSWSVIHIKPFHQKTSTNRIVTSLKEQMSYFSNLVVIGP